MLILRYIVIVCWFLLSLLQAQTNPAVQQAFEALYPQAQEVQYSKDENNLYQVTFEIQGKEHEAYFDIAGEWLKTYVEIERQELPVAVQKSLENFDGVESFQKLINPKGEFYECVVYKKGETYVVILSEKGRVVKKVKEEDYEG